MCLFSRTDLMKAVKKGKVEEVKSELELVKDNKEELEKTIPHSGHTALFLAISYVDQHVNREEGVEIVRILIEEGKMNLHHKSKGNEYTPLLLAAYHNLHEIVHLIWKTAKTTDILRAKSIDGDNSLHLCAYQGDTHLETAKTLIRIAQDLKKDKNKNDQLPLDVAVERSNKRMADLLSSSNPDGTDSVCRCVIQ